MESIIVVKQYMEWAQPMLHVLIGRGPITKPLMNRTVLHLVNMDSFNVFMGQDRINHYHWSVYQEINSVME